MSETQKKSLRRDVFVFPPHRDEDVVGFGGGRFFSSRPSYETSYLLASQLLYQSALNENLLAEVLTPLLYLHRHILELCMKDGLDSTIRYLDLRNARAVATGESVEEIPESARKAVNHGHDLQKLLSQLQQLDALMALDNLTLPRVLSELVDVVASDEVEFRQKGTVHRYAENLAHNNALEHFANKARKFPIHERQGLVERMFEEMMGAADEDFYDPKSYSVSVALETYALDPHGEF